MDFVGVAWGNVAEWASGVGALAAAGVALFVANRAQRNADRAQRNVRDERRAAARAAARDRTAALLVQLIREVEKDIAASEAAPGPHAVVTSPEGAALCRALWGYRNLFGTTWAVYCEGGKDTYDWVSQLRKSDELFPRMREELQSALDTLNQEDRSA